MEKTLSEIVKVVALKAPVSKVWHALTDHEAFGSWFGVALDQPFAVDSPSTGKMTDPGCGDMPWLARVDTMEPERHFAFRWHVYDPDSQVPLEAEPTTLVTFRLEAQGRGTRLTIAETGFDVLEEPRRAQVMERNTYGWNVQAERIAGFVGG